jgi:hypothetical protein
MPPGTPLSQYLRARRALIRPEDAGLSHGGRRRVSGLRREELAMLAGTTSADVRVARSARHASASWPA